MDLDLNGMKALVTGASYGLGFACAKSLSNEGVSVAICSRDQERVSAAAEEISSSTSNKAFGFAADLTQENDLSELVAKTKEYMGGIDILVLSTGHPPTYSFTNATDKHWEDGINLVLKPAIALTRALLPEMRRQKYGRLIYIGSIFGLQPESSSIIQSTLRTGLNAFSKCIATEVAAEGVTANVICPGYFETPLVKNLAAKYANEQSSSVDSVMDDWKSSSPTMTFGDPNDWEPLFLF